MAKGSTFERQVCRELSLWWTGGGSDAVFYRTGGSGGRATRRGRAGKSTVNHCGDVQASDPVGMPFVRLCATELKRGYNRDTLHDVIDSPTFKEQAWEGWVKQAQESARHARSIYWLVIARRDRRRPVCLMPETMWRMLGLAGARIMTITPRMELHTSDTGAVVLLGLDAFLAGVKPEHVIREAGA